MQAITGQPRFVARKVREHDVRRGGCMLWTTSNKLSKLISFLGQFRPSEKQTSERIRSTSDILGKYQDKGEREQEDMGSLSHSSAGVTPIKRKEDRRRTLRKICCLEPIKDCSWEERQLLCSTAGVSQRKHGLSCSLEVTVPPEVLWRNIYILPSLPPLYFKVQKNKLCLNPDSTYPVNNFSWLIRACFKNLQRPLFSSERYSKKDDLFFQDPSVHESMTEYVLLIDIGYNHSFVIQQTQICFKCLDCNLGQFTSLSASFSSIPKWVGCTKWSLAPSYSINLSFLLF